MTDKNTSHLAGEFLVAGELARRGYPVAITFGNAKSVDIYATSKSGVLQIDAKAGRSKGNWPITENNINQDMFYILVYLQSPKNILEKNSSPEYFVISGQEITYHAHRTWFDEDPSKGSKSIAIPADYNPIFRTQPIKIKDYEHRTSNVEF